VASATQATTGVRQLELLPTVLGIEGSFSRDWMMDFDGSMKNNIIWQYNEDR
jgi:hypothetical protein